MILVAVNKRILLTTIKLKLEKSGYTVVSTGDGQEALSLIQRENIDLIICSVMMSSASGYEIAQESKSRKIPVIMLTTMRQKKVMAKALEMGAEYYMAIPFSMKELHEKVNLILSPVAGLEFKAAFNLKNS